MTIFYGVAAHPLSLSFAGIELSPFLLNSEIIKTTKVIWKTLFRVS